MHTVNTDAEFEHMNTVCETDQCAGCMACLDICPRNAIHIQDSLNAFNAVIDHEKCINCNACHLVCQHNHPPTFRKTNIWKQGWAEDEAVRHNSSSGGAAASIERAFVKNGGVVYSCTFLSGEFCFRRAATEEEVKRFVGSKYVKSNPTGIYKMIRQDLKKGEKVLFLGLPCQAAAVINYCGENENLYIIDLICHGSPSPQLLQLYLNDHGIRLTNLSSLDFRKKGRFCLIPNRKDLINPRIRDYYTMLFLNGTTYTENCYSCKYAKTERLSDITLGDSWGSELPEEEQKKGISLIMVQTEKGAKIIEQSDLVTKAVNPERAIVSNRQLQHPSEKSKERAQFWENLGKGYSFTKAAAACFPKQHFKNEVKKILIFLRIMK